MQKPTNQVFGNEMGKNLMIYMDDIIIFDKNIRQHKKRVAQIISKLEKAKFRINPKKIQPCKNQVKLLGMIIDGEERTPIEEQETKIIKHRYPSNISELRGFLGSVGWLRGFKKIRR